MIVVLLYIDRAKEYKRAITPVPRSARIQNSYTLEDHLLQCNYIIIAKIALYYNSTNALYYTSKSAIRRGSVNLTICVLSSERV
jgi:hypothetical protein